MKKVFTNANDVIHLFAQQSQSEGRSSNVFFEDKKLYSYGHHYLLAEFLDDNTVFINDDGYSVTTSKHISQASYALRQYKRFFKSGSDLETVYYSIINNKNKLANARKPEMYIENILSLWGLLNEYINYCKLKIKKDKMYIEIKKIVSCIENDADGYKQNLAIYQKNKKIADKKKAKKLLKESLKKFFSYEINTFRIPNTDDYVRISKNSEYVETSQGVKIPIKSAKTLYNLIKAGKDIKGYEIDYYTVISINGTLKIGCHNINMDNVHEIGEKVLSR